MKPKIRLFLPFLLIFAIFSACTAEKQIDIFILLNRFNSFSDRITADENSVYYSDSGSEPKYSVPVTGDVQALLTAYPDEYGNLTAVSITAEGEADTTAMQGLICSFTGEDKTEAYDIIKKLTEPDVRDKLRYTQSVNYRFTYTANEQGYYFSVEDKKYISTENAEFTLRQTTALRSSQ